MHGGYRLGGIKVVRGSGARVSRSALGPRATVRIAKLMLCRWVVNVSNGTEALKAVNLRRFATAIPNFPPSGPAETMQGLGRTPTFGYARKRFEGYRQ